MNRLPDGFEPQFGNISATIQKHSLKAVWAFCLAQCCVLEDQSLAGDACDHSATLVLDRVGLIRKQLLTKC
jgi:hypothetical protein